MYARMSHGNYYVYVAPLTKFINGNSVIDNIMRNNELVGRQKIVQLIVLLSTSLADNFVAINQT